MAEKFETNPPPTPSYELSYPSPHVLLITINRPKAMNSLPYASHWEADTLITWFENEPSLRVAVITGKGDKAFCAGQDLIEQGKIRAAAAEGKEFSPRSMQTHPLSGFMGISRRIGKKPLIAAVNGFAMGGGFEICLGCDMMVASPRAQFGLPEATRGMYAAAGGLSKIVRLVGLPIGSEMALTGRVLSAEEALRYNVVNYVSKTHESVVDEAVALAAKVADLSPDAIIVSKHGLKMALEEGSVESAARRTDDLYGRQLYGGENLRIGLKAFAEKKKPQWIGSKL